jgi:integrative and conjugative element protein (TIGR02256 family)
VSEHALQLASRHAREGFPNEIGGILIGWREGKEVVVHDLVLITDETAGSHHYDRSQRQAQQLLEKYTADSGDDRLGYVGEWHSHPAHSPPSTTDLRALRAIAQTLGQPIALIVLAAHCDGSSIEPIGTIARARSRGNTQLRSVHVNTY